MRTSPWSCICVALGLSVAALAQERLRSFGPPDTGDGLPGFGQLPEDLPKVIEQDHVKAVSAIRKVDTNKDGVMSRRELRDSNYKKYEERRFRFDFNRDNKLTTKELANYYARIRVDKET
ncbi:MAG: hypothetical protein IH991_24905, partial [Planctomycetes bacterium]|nr:hypothetical protein [Planctomycetota bacterium]